ncbi:MAG: hypothetical protein IKN43_03020 [Selenomonadaceae bacterium]|nr:hypothetical protein [Selenomonadaceae bacterium]
MKNLAATKILAAAVLGTAVAFGGSAPAWCPDMAKVEAKSEVQQGIDWTKGSKSSITAKGVGLSKNGVAAMARTADLIEAQRILLGLIKGVQIDSETLMENLMVQSDTVKRQIGGVLQGAEVIDEGANSDGSYYVVMSVPLFGEKGSVASAALPIVMKSVKREPPLVVKPKEAKITPVEVKKVQTAEYTGVVVDAGGMGLEPTFSPVIFDSNGRAVYGIKNIDPDFAIREGMVGYANDVASASSNKRVGAKPLVVKAVSLKTGAGGVNKVNAVVSPEDADRILLANEKSKMLDKCAVMMVR